MFQQSPCRWHGGNVGWSGQPGRALRTRVWEQGGALVGDAPDLAVCSAWRTQGGGLSWGTHHPLLLWLSLCEQLLRALLPLRHRFQSTGPTCGQESQKRQFYSLYGAQGKMTLVGRHAVHLIPGSVGARGPSDMPHLLLHCSASAHAAPASTWMTWDRPPPIRHHPSQPVPFSCSSSHPLRFQVVCHHPRDLPCSHPPPQRCNTCLCEMPLPCSPQSAHGRVTAPALHPEQSPCSIT